MWFRKIKSINLPKFKNDIRTSELLLNTPNHLDDLVNCFNTTLKSITYKHAPWRKRSMTQRVQAPWLSDEITCAKRRRRIAERNWRSTKSESDWRTFKLLRNKVVFLMSKSRREFYTDFVSNISGDQRKFFTTTKKLFNQTADMPFPPHGDKLALANDMGSFFIKKTSDLRVSLDATENLCSTVNRHSSHCSSSFTPYKKFRPISNLSFVSKLAERVAADQIQSYLNEHDLFPSLQSAYRRHHSTETVLLKVKSDILMNMEN